MKKQAWLLRREEKKGGWRQEQRQRRWNCLNQSFILLLPMCCTVIEVKVTGSPPPPFDTLTTHPAQLADKCAVCVQVSRVAVQFGSANRRNAGLHSLMGMQSLQERREVTKVILQLQCSPDGSWGIVICWQKPGCVTLNSGCYPETKSVWRAWLWEKVAVISEPPAYQMPPISPSRWWEDRVEMAAFFIVLTLVKKMGQGNIFEYDLYNQTEWVHGGCLASGTGHL